MPGSSWQDVFEQVRARQAELASDSHDPNVPDPSLPLSDVQTYQTVAVTEIVQPADATLTSAAKPVDLLSKTRRRPPQLPAVGVVLTVEQAWRMRGLTKGRLLHSLCLAPGEVTQVAMVGWQRGTTGNTTAVISEQEAAGRTTERTRDISSISTAVASQVNAGGSASASFATQANVGVGGLIGVIAGSGGVSGNASLATSASFSIGTRDASADSRQGVRESTAEQTSNVRARSATLVTEVTQSETEQFTSRVVANYNHMHALNIQYYEVLQVYELAAVPTRAERCIFLPMATMTFDRESARTFAVPLARAARAMGRNALALAIEDNARSAARTGRRIQQLQETVDTYQAQIGDLLASLPRLDAELVENADRVATLPGEVAVANAKIVELTGQLVRLDVDLVRWRAVPETLRPGVDLAAMEAERQQAVDRIATWRGRIDAYGRETTSRQARIAEVFAERNRVQEEQFRLMTPFDLARTELTFLRDQAERAEQQAAQLERELAEDNLALNQALWLQMDPATVQTLVAGKQWQGQPIGATIDPTPVAIVGNYVGYRWGFPADEAGRAAAAAFRTRYVDEHREPPTDRRVLPTGGLFAESVLGRSVAAETLDLTRFWRWDDDTIPLLPTAIGTLKAAEHAQRAESVPGRLAAAAATLAELPAAPAGPGDALAGVIGTSMFRDMSGSAVIGGLLQAAQKVTGDGARHAQEVAHQNISAFLDHAEQLLPQLTKAISSGKIDPSTMGALKNALGSGEGGGFDIASLLGTAAEAGLML